MLVHSHRAIIGLFGRILSLLYGSFAKKTCNFTLIVSERAYPRECTNKNPSSKCTSIYARAFMSRNSGVATVSRID